MAVEPRWPRGAPDDEHGHGQGGRWVRALSAAMSALPSLKDAVHGRVSQDDLDEAAKSLEGYYGSGGMRVQKVHIYRLPGWLHSTRKDGDGETDDGESFMPYGRLQIGGEIASDSDPQNHEGGYFRVTAYAGRDKAGDPLTWRMHLDRMHVRGDAQGGGGGRELTDRLTDWARQSGLDEATVGPSEVGSYAWGAIGFDFAELSDRKIAWEGAMTMTVADVRRSLGYWPDSYPPLPEDDREIARMIRQYKWAASRALAGTMSYQKLSQYGRKPGQGKNDWWAGKLGLIVGGVGSGRMKL